MTCFCFHKILGKVPQEDGSDVNDSKTNIPEDKVFFIIYFYYVQLQQNSNFIVKYTCNEFP